MRKALAFAPGKLILTGEHAVVYGHPAIAMAVDRGTTVELWRREGPTRIERADLSDMRLFAAVVAVVPHDGVGIAITSDLPVGRGMGSSGALAVALVRAWAALEEEQLDFDDVHARGFAVERVFHGTPSGLDHAVSALGGGVRYHRGEDGPVIRPLELPPLQLVVLDSGVAGDTGKLVAGVRSRRPAIDPLLEELGALSRRIEACLLAGGEGLGPLLDHNHTLLQGIGVSTPQLDGLVELARGAGALGAKLSGAGGGGVVLALVDEPGPVLQAARAAGVSAFPVGVQPPSLPSQQRSSS